MPIVIMKGMVGLCIPIEITCKEVVAVEILKRDVQTLSHVKLWKITAMKNRVRFKTKYGQEVHGDLSATRLQVFMPLYRILKICTIVKQLL